MNSNSELQENGIIESEDISQEIRAVSLGLGITGIGLSEPDFGPWGVVEEQFEVVRDSSIPRTTFNPIDWAPIMSQDDYEEDIISPLPRRTNRASPLVPQQHLRAPATDIAPFRTRIPTSEILRDLSELEEAQQELLEQIRALESAHSELEEARRSLIQTLQSLEIGGQVNEDESMDELSIRLARNNILGLHRERLQDQGEESSDDEDDYNFYESARVGMGMTQRAPLGLFDDNEQSEDLLDMFLDANGEPCTGFDDCLHRAVGWAGENDMLEFGIDCNGDTSVFDGVPAAKLDIAFILR